MLPNAITYLSFNLMAFSVFSSIYVSRLFFLWRGFILRNLPKLKITQFSSSFLSYIFFSGGQDERRFLLLKMFIHTETKKEKNEQCPLCRCATNDGRGRGKTPISFSLFTLFSLIMLDGCYRI